MQSKILLIEDDEKLGRQVVQNLGEAGFPTDWIKSGDDALDARVRSYSLIILDLMLPGTHGLDVLKYLRIDSDIPVLVLSARHDTSDKVRALELGADDYMTKPFWPEELVARVQARLRRPVMERDGRVENGDLLIDLRARRAFVKQAAVDLTKVEFELLAALAMRPGAAVSRLKLVERVLDPDRDGTERTLDVHMSRLRKKLGACGTCIATVWGVGYRMELSAS